MKKNCFDVSPQVFDSDSGSFIVGPVELRVPRADGSVQVNKQKSLAN